MEIIKVCVAGATGWAGSELCRGIHKTDDLHLVAGISRSQAGKNLGDLPGFSGMDVPLFASVDDAMSTHPHVLVEYTGPLSARQNVLAALRGGVHVVVGTSGLSNPDYDEIQAAALQARRGVLAVGNFALTAVLLQKFAEMAAKYIPHWEIIDYASSTKPDAPSGTTRQLADRLSTIRESTLDVPLEKTEGIPETRGARLQGSQVHSLRLPGYVISVETIFGMPDQRLTLRHDSGNSALPYVDGALLAIRHVVDLIGLSRGLDSVMKF